MTAVNGLPSNPVMCKCKRYLYIEYVQARMKMLFLKDVSINKNEFVLNNSFES